MRATTPTFEVFTKRRSALTNPHSPGQIRAFAPLRNVDAWYAAFDIKGGDAEYVKPEDRARIW